MRRPALLLYFDFQLIELFRQLKMCKCPDALSTLSMQRESNNLSTRDRITARDEWMRWGSGSAAATNKTDNALLLKRSK